MKDAAANDGFSVMVGLEFAVTLGRLTARLTGVDVRALAHQDCSTVICSLTFGACDSPRMNSTSTTSPSFKLV
jgi:hypothetical protein